MSRATSRRLLLSSFGVLLAAGALHSFDLASKRDVAASDDCIVAEGWPVTVRSYRQAEGLDVTWTFVFIGTRPDGEEVAWVVHRPYAEPNEDDWREARSVFATLEAVYS